MTDNTEESCSIFFIALNVIVIEMIDKFNQ